MEMKKKMETLQKKNVNIDSYFCNLRHF